MRRPAVAKGSLVKRRPAGAKASVLKRPARRSELNAVEATEQEASCNDSCIEGLEHVDGTYLRGVLNIEDSYLRGQWYVCNRVYVANCQGTRCTSHFGSSHFR